MAGKTLPKTMRAARLYEYGGPEVLKVEDVELPVPGEGEVLMKVNAIAVNGWDIRFREGHAPQVPGRPAPSLPFQLGREAAGEIAALGEGVKSRRVGERVVMMANPSCGKCHYCSKRNTHLCINSELPGHTQPGANAEYIVRPADGVLPTPKSLTDEEAAPVIWAYGTALHMVDLAKVQVGDVVVVTGGASAMGVACIQLSRLAGASKVIAVSRSADKAEILKSVGADEVVDHSDPDALTRVRQLSNGIGADVIFDNYGSPETIDFALSAADLGGRIVLAASTNESLDQKVGVRTGVFIPKHVSVLGTRASTRWEQQEVLRLAGEGKIAMRIAETLPFEEIRKAHELQAASKHVGKIVLTM